MNPASLNALIIDRELGELPPEAAELLDAWLTEHPESADEVARTRRTLQTTQAAIRRFPELARPEPSVQPEAEVISLPAVRSRFMSFALAASVLLLAGGTGWLGFRAGRVTAPSVAGQSPIQSTSASSAQAVGSSGPWARYALAVDPRGRLLAVRRDPHTQP